MVNVRAVERDQQWLMPPSLREWLPPDHLAWFILDVVAELDLSRFYGGMRSDGRGGASYDPALMVGVLFYAYCVGERSSRRIERRLTEDVAFRVVAANQCPDHATLARFRRTYQDAVAGLFAQVLGLCAAGGLISAGVVAIDGTKIEADASGSQTRTRRRIADELLADAEEIDAAEDEAFGDRRGDELPERWIDSRDRRTRLAEALRQLDADGPADPETHRAVREAKEAELGHKLPGRKPDPDARWGKKAKSRMANVTDPDSRLIKDRRRYVQGYNAQAAVTEDQVIVAAEMTNSARDSTIFQHMVTATEQNLAGAGAMKPGAFVADAGYWSGDNAGLECGAKILIAPMPATSDITHPDDPRLHQRQAMIERLDRAEISIAEAAAELGVSKTWARKLLANHRRGGDDPVQLRVRMLERLHSPDGAAAFAKRGITVEPVFGNLKANLGYRRFSRRGFTAVASEWRLICTAHNLLKLHRHQPATS
jgi:transposase